MTTIKNLLLIALAATALWACTKGLFQIDKDAVTVPKEFQLEEPPPPAGDASTQVGTPGQTTTDAAVKTKTAPKPKKTKVLSLERFPDVKGEFPFKEKERLQYLLSYFALKGGIVTLEVRSPRIFEERPAMYLWGHVKSSFLMNLIYRVDNTMDVLMDQKKFLPLRGSFSLNETAQVKQRVVLYDHVKGQARFWSKGVHKERGPEEFNRVDPMSSGSQDLFSAFYYVRMIRPEVGKKYEIPVYENGKNMKVIVRGLEEDVILTRMGAVNCVKSQIETSIDGVLKQTGEVYLWLSTEPDAAMIKFSAKVKVGEIKGILIRRDSTDNKIDLSM